MIIYNNQTLSIFGINLYENEESNYNDQREYCRIKLQGAFAEGYSTGQIIEILGCYFIIDEFRRLDFQWYNINNNFIQIEIRKSITKNIKDFQTFFKDYLGFYKSPVYISLIEINNDDKFVLDNFGKSFPSDILLRFEIYQQCYLHIIKTFKITKISKLSKVYTKFNIKFIIECDFDCIIDRINYIRIKDRNLFGYNYIMFVLENSYYFDIYHSIEYFNENYTTKNSLWKIIIKPLIKILSLHKRSVERLYHPDRLKAQGYFDLIEDIIIN